MNAPQGTLTASHTGSARRSARQARVQRLIAADETSFAELELLLATLPEWTTGRIFIEIPDASHRIELDVPSRMTLTWLDRSTRSGAPGTGQCCAPGAAVTRAVTSWADEMMCDEASAPVETRTLVHLLCGYLGTADIVDHLTDSLGVASESIHTPAQFNLLTQH